MLMQLKVLVTSRSFAQASNEPYDLLIQNGFAVEYYNSSFTEAEFVARLKDCDALIIGGHKLTPDALAAAKKLKIVCKHGTGLDNIDIGFAQKMNLKVTNVPAVNSDAVADLAFGLILNVARRISLSHLQVKNEIWKTVTGTDVYHKTLGLIGFGAIAKKVAKRSIGFDMKVLAFDPYVDEAGVDFANVRLVSFDEVLEKADFVSVHVPLNEKTKDLIAKAAFLKMKQGSFIINTSRGGIVNETDLYDSLRSGHLGGAGLDVFAKEPPYDSQLLELDNVVTTAHIGMYSKEALTEVSLICARNIIRFFAGEKLDYEVV
jgi:D-3-phosphoglycerate dehydrogenase